MKSAIFVTVRTGSTRLKNKALLKIRHKHTIEYVLDQAEKCKLADGIILCTTDLPEDDELCNIAARHGINYYRGSVEDKLDRWLGGAIRYDVEFFVTADGDDLFCSSELIDLAFEQYQKTGVDFIHTEEVVCGSFTYGIKTSALEQVCLRKLSSDTEMMWTYFIDTGLFNISTLDGVPKVYKRSDVRMTLDYQDDFKFFEAVINGLEKRDFTTRDVLNFLDENEEVKEINFYLQDAWAENQKQKTNLQFK